MNDLHGFACYLHCMLIMDLHVMYMDLYVSFTAERVSYKGESSKFATVESHKYTGNYVTDHKNQHTHYP